MKESTRDKIIETAIPLIAKSGFNHTGIAEILKKAKVPKGSFYYYFESKEALGYAIIEKAAKDQFDALDALINNVQGSPLKKIRLFFEFLIEQYDFEAAHTCILGNLGQELAEQHEGFRQQLEQVFYGIEQYFTGLFEEAKTAGELARDIDSLKLTNFLFYTWEGAILASKIKKSKEPLSNCVNMFFYLFLNI